MEKSLPPTAFLALLFSVAVLFMPVKLASSSLNSSFSRSFYVNWGVSNARIDGSGDAVELTLDRLSGSGFASIHQYLFASVSMQIKLVPGNSAGTVTAFYMSSQTDSGDELDFEFLGELSPRRYILQTNVFAGGHGNREQRLHLWFDPAESYHTYSIHWNEDLILFSVDSLPIRAFLNNEAHGVPYPNSKHMGVFATLWDGDSWATEGGRMKIDWSGSPFVAGFRGFSVEGCSAWPSCAWASSQSQRDTLSPAQLDRLRWIKHSYMTYDYCSDQSRFQQMPPECRLNP